MKTALASRQVAPERISYIRPACDYKELHDTLKAERIVLDWRKQQKTRAAVRVAIFDALEQLPEPYTTDLYAQKCEVVYQHVYEAYVGIGQSVY